uniref:Transposase n=1 Tax=Rhabditophanes sp. KR3021 TaxID=114890 RepID=A0AC35TX02_9BILA
MNAIKTCVSGSQCTEPARPKRFIHGDKIIRHYTKSLLDKAVLLITDKRILLSNKNSVLGSWSTEWEMLHTEIDYPKQTDNCSIEC